MAVVRSGRYTKSGQPIYVAAPTRTSVAREVAAKRVQTYSSSGDKISDTQRVEVNVGGGEKRWVTPERALAVEPKGTIKYREAERKKAEMEQQARTISQRVEQQQQQEQEPTSSKLSESLVKEQEPKPEPKVFDPSNPYVTSGEAAERQREESSYPEEKRYTGSTISKPDPDLLKATKRQRNPFFKAFEAFKSGFQGSPSTRDTFTGGQKLEVALTGRNPVTGEIESKAEARTRSFASTAGTALSIGLTSKGIPKGLKAIDKVGDVVRGSKVATRISQSGKIGKASVLIGTYGGQAYGTYKVGKEAVNRLAPYETKQERLIGVSDKEFNQIYSTAKVTEMKSAFESDRKIFNVPYSEKVVGYFKGTTTPLFTQVLPPSNEFTQTITKESKARGLNQQQISLIQERAIQKRKGMGFVQTVNILQAESYANLAGASYLTSKPFRSKIVPGMIEGSIATGAILGSTESDLPAFIPMVQGKELQPAWSSLDDNSFSTQRVSISQEEYDRLGLSKGVSLPDKTNLIYNVVGKPQVTTEQTGKETITTTTVPITETVFSQSREAEKPRFSITEGLFPYKGKQKKFVPSKALLVSGGATFGAVSAGLFGVVESRFTGRVGSKVVSGAGYVSDIPELPGDFVTPLMTSSKGTRSYSTRTLSNMGFIQSPSSTKVDVKLNEELIPTKRRVKRVQTITATRTQEFDMTKSFSSASTQNTFSSVKSDVFSNVPVTVNTQVGTFTKTNTNVNTAVDVFSKGNTQVGTFTGVNANVISNVNTNVNSRVTSNVNVFTPKLPVLFPLSFDFFGGEGSYRRKKRKKRATRYTPDFMASVLNQFGAAPRKRFFTGQERRFKIKGRKFISKLPKSRKQTGILQLLTGGLI